MDAFYDFAVTDLADEWKVAEVTAAIQEAVKRVTGNHVQIFPYIES